MTASVHDRGFPAMFADAAAAPFRPEHAVLRGEVRAWVSENIVPFAAEWEQAREFPRSLYAAAGDAGLLGWKYGPDDGGRGPDLLADVVVSEELTRCGSGGVAAGLGAPKDLAPFYVARFGTGEQRARWLRPAVAGRQVAALAVTEPEAGSDVAGIRCRATPDGDGGWTLDGTKCFITNGSRADWVLVAARSSDEPGWRGLSLFVVETTAPGFTADRIATLGWRTSQTGLLHLDAVRVGADALVGDGGDGFVMIMKSFQWERLCMAIAAVAGAAASLERVAEWSATAPDARWWELAREVAAARALAYAALTAVINGRDVVPAVSAAKLLGCDLAVAAADYLLAKASAVSVAEAERAERALRDARLGPVGGGAREVMAELVARSLPWA